MKHIDENNLRVFLDEITEKEPISEDFIKHTLCFLITTTLRGTHNFLKILERPEYFFRKVLEDFTVENDVENKKLYVDKVHQAIGYLQNTDIELYAEVVFEIAYGNNKIEYLEIYFPDIKSNFSVNGSNFGLPFENNNTCLSIRKLLHKIALHGGFDEFEEPLVPKDYMQIFCLELSKKTLINQALLEKADVYNRSSIIQKILELLEIYIFNLKSRGLFDPDCELNESNNIFLPEKMLYKNDQGTEADKKAADKLFETLCMLYECSPQKFSSFRNKENFIWYSQFVEHRNVISKNKGTPFYHAEWFKEIRGVEQLILN